MNLRKLGRVFALSLSVILLGAVAARAHSLPGSELTLASQEQGLTLTLKMPLDELVISAPQFAPLLQAALNADLPSQDVDALALYVTRHLTLAQASNELDLQVSRAQIQTAFHHDVGAYRVLEVAFDLPDVPVMPVNALTLTYDAVMHEVRSHRAAVFWDHPDRGVVRLVGFGYRPVNGRQKSVELTAP